MLPMILRNNFFDDFMDFPTMRDFDNVEKKLYGKNGAHIMKTDISEHEDHYEMAIDLPGFKKEDLSLSLENGYLTVTASKGVEKDEQNEKGNYIHRERYSGSVQRSYYVGDDITEEDIKAKFENGLLSLTLPKKDTKKLPEKKTIAIE